MIANPTPQPFRNEKAAVVFHGLFCLLHRAEKREIYLFFTEVLFFKFRLCPSKKVCGGFSGATEIID